VLDPPSSGLSLEVVDALGALAIPRLALVSSDPATLARDSQRLTQHGYRLARVQPIDLAPQTYYIDAVAIFERAT
jgi:23S rRNA (uracil1939-C5)-methyltransferase